jgi:hypothetical protein
VQDHSSSINTSWVALAAAWSGHSAQVANSTWQASRTALHAQATRMLELALNLTHLATALDRQAGDQSGSVALLEQPDAPGLQLASDPGGTAMDSPDRLDQLQLALSIAGMAPGAEIFDLANAAISLGRGQYVAATLGLLAAVPIIGNLATAQRLARGTQQLTRRTAVMRPAARLAQLARQRATQFLSKLGALEKHPLRQAYQAEVTALANSANTLRAGLGPHPNQAQLELLARVMHARRRELGVLYKNTTPKPLLDAIYARNLKLYEDKLGPSFESLARKYHGDMDKVIEAASRPNPSIDQLLKSDLRDWIMDHSERYFTLRSPESYLK